MDTAGHPLRQPVGKGGLPYGCEWGAGEDTGGSVERKSPAVPPSPFRAPTFLAPPSLSPDHSCPIWPPRLVSQSMDCRHSGPIIIVHCRDMWSELCALYNVLWLDH